jgi:hypothetical protein
MNYKGLAACRTKEQRRKGDAKQGKKEKREKE